MLFLCFPDAARKTAFALHLLGIGEKGIQIHVVVKRAVAICVVRQQFNMRSGACVILDDVAATDPLAQLPHTTGSQGGIRNKTDVTGELTYKIAKEIHTFSNVACLQTITGQQLLDALEWGTRSAGTGEECGGFLQVAGITYEVAASWPTSVQMDDKGVWTGAPTGGYRVSNVQVYNKETQAYEPLDLTASYNLAGYNYTLRDLGDGFSMFSGAVNVLDYVIEDYMVLANYVQGVENGAVDASNSPLVTKYSNMMMDYGMKPLMMSWNTCLGKIDFGM